MCRYTDTHTLTLTTHTCRHFTCMYTPTLWRPSPPPKQSHHSARSQLTLQQSMPPRPAPGAQRYSLALLLGYYPAEDGQEKSWETMALLPSPSCSTPASPTAPPAWPSWAHSLVLWAAEKLIPPTSHQGRAPARQDPPLPAGSPRRARTWGREPPSGGDGCSLVNPSLPCHSISC